MRYLLASLGLLAFASVATAQVADGSQWTDGRGHIVTVRVFDADPNNSAVAVVFMDSGGGYTQPVGGVAATGSTTEKPKAHSSQEATTQSGSASFRIRNGRTERKIDGKWMVQKELKKKASTKRKQVARMVYTPWGPVVVPTQAWPDEGGSSLPGGSPPRSL